MKIIRFILDGGNGNIETAAGMILPQICQTAAESGVTVKELEMLDLNPEADLQVIKIPEFIRRTQ